MKKRISSLFIAGIVLFFFVSVSHGEALSPELCKAKVKAAVALLKAEGEAAIAKIEDPNGEFRFADGKGYIWVHNLEGIMVMHPIKPSLNGKNLLSLRDVNGTYLFVAMNEVAEDSGSGWVPYLWPKPGEKDPSPKVSYVELVESGDNSYVAGSGMYDVSADDIKKMFPGDAIYSAD